MKKITYSVAFVATLLASSNTFAQQGFGTNTPHRSAAVEIKSTNKGLLIPRIALTSATQKLNTSVNNANSLLVYNDGTTLPKGYYYWDENYVVTSATIGNGTEENPETPAVLGKWIAFSTVGGSNALGAENALTLNTTTNKVELGGSLNRATQITLNGNQFTIASDNNKFAITGLTDGLDVTNIIPYLLVQDNDNGTVYNAAPNEYFSKFIKGKNGITIEEGDQADLHVKLGGTIDEVTNLHIADNASVSVTGLKRMDGTAVTPTGLDASVAALGGNSVETGHLIPVGTTMNGTLKVATAKEIVDAGIVSVTNIITPAVHTPASGENPGSTTEGTLVTKVNDDTSVAVDMTALVQSVQKTYRFTSNNQSVAINETLGSNANGYVNTIDLAVSTDNIEGAGSLTSDDLEIPTNTALLADLEINIKNEGVKANHINVNVAGQGLVQEASGALKVNVNNGLEYGTANTADATGDFVQLGGALTRATTLTATAANTLAIAGLQNTNGNTVATLGDNQFASVLVDKNGVLRTMEKSSTIALTDATTLTGYQTYYEEVIVNYTLGVTGDSDVTLALPPASVTNNGQVINLRISASSENKFLVITGADVSVEGSMPYQGWVFKSNGTTWNLVATK